MGEGGQDLVRGAPRQAPPALDLPGRGAAHGRSRRRALWKGRARTEGGGRGLEGGWNLGVTNREGFRARTQRGLDPGGDSAMLDVVKVSFSRTGGVAGVKLETELESEELPASEAARLLELLKAGRPRKLAASVARSGADRFRYRIDVESDGGRRTLELDEESLPENCRALVDCLVDVARRARKVRR